ncbi:MAG: HalD/BesD family halogenase [bacterium]
MSITHSLIGLVNLKQYPLDDLDSTKGRQLIRDCRKKINDRGSLTLESFFPATETEKLVSEVRQKLSLSHRMQGNFSPYSDDLNAEDNLNLRHDHPSRLKLPASHRFLAGDLVALSSPLQQLYRDQQFINFLAAVLDQDALYPLSDTLGCVNILAYEPGDSNGWHFDTTEFVISIMLQAAGRGGEYQFIPGMRSDADDNLEAISYRMNNPEVEHGINRVTLAPGTLFLFRGRNTLHRVTRVEQEPERLVAILSYHKTPGHVLSEGSKLAMYGRSA